MIIKRHMFGEYESSFSSTETDKVDTMCKELDDAENDISEFYTEKNERIFFWRKDGKIHGNIFNYPEEDIPESAIANGYVKMECPFCRDYNTCVDTAEYHKKDNCANKYKSALVHETYYNNEKTGQASFGNHPLNFCPTCGKELKKMPKLKLLFDKQHYDAVYRVLVSDNGFPVTVFLSGECIEIEMKDLDILGKALPEVEFTKF